jgi:hypothetical protein
VLGADLDLSVLAPEVLGALEAHHQACQLGYGGFHAEDCSEVTEYEERTYRPSIEVQEVSLAFLIKEGAWCCRTTFDPSAAGLVRSLVELRDATFALTATCGNGFHFEAARRAVEAAVANPDLSALEDQLRAAVTTSSAPLLELLHGPRGRDALFLEASFASLRSTAGRDLAGPLADLEDLLNLDSCATFRPDFGLPQELSARTLPAGHVLADVLELVRADVTMRESVPGELLVAGSPSDVLPGKGALRVPLEAYALSSRTFLVPRGLEPLVRRAARRSTQVSLAVLRTRPSRAVLETAATLLDDDLNGLSAARAIAAARRLA